DKIEIEGPIAFQLGSSSLIELRSLEYREDLKEAGISNGYGWFSFVSRLKDTCEVGTHITARCGGATHKVPASDQLSLRPFHARGAIDIVGPEGIVGWIFDPAIHFKGQMPQLIIDGTGCIDIAIDRDRGDIPFNIVGKSKR